jgi:signal recognition particle receptor subunit beta
MGFSPEEVKIIFTGPVGAGKTTAINTISEIDTISTEALATDEVAALKETTTGGMDYGEITIDEGLVLRLYGTPGQVRFMHMWQILGRGALGIIVLIDNSRHDPLQDLALYLDGFKAFASESAIVIAVTRTEQAPQPDLEVYHQFLLQRHESYPVMTADIRRREDVLGLFEVLLTYLEIE